jgi:signal transduction histidine kinase
VVEVLAIVAAGFAALGAGLRLAPLAGVPVAMAALLTALTIGDASIVPAALVTAAPWAAGAVLRSRRALVTALAARNRELEAEQAALAELAVRRERTRIARELHDIVAHHLAVMVIQAGAGRLGAADAERRLAGIRDAGTEALAELDHLVELLQADDARPRDVDALLAQARAAGVELDYTPLPAGVDVAPEVRDGAYRVVQEGLTNAMKHAAGSAVRVRLGVRAQELEVEVRDDGPVAHSPLAASGARLGLTGMRERVEALGGDLEAGPANGGWRLHARLPLHTPTG